MLNLHSERTDDYYFAKRFWSFWRGGIYFVIVSGFAIGAILCVPITYAVCLFSDYHYDWKIVEHIQEIK